MERVVAMAARSARPPRTTRRTRRSRAPRSRRGPRRRAGTRRPRGRRSRPARRRRCARRTGSPGGARRARRRSSAGARRQRGADVLGRHRVGRDDAARLPHEDRPRAVDDRLLVEHRAHAPLDRLVAKLAARAGQQVLHAGAHGRTRRVPAAPPRAIPYRPPVRFGMSTGPRPARATRIAARRAFAAAAGRSTRTVSSACRRWRRARAAPAPRTRRRRRPARRAPAAPECSPTRSSSGCARPVPAPNAARPAGAASTVTRNLPRSPAYTHVTSCGSFDTRSACAPGPAAAVIRGEHGGAGFADFAVGAAAFSPPPQPAAASAARTTARRKRIAGNPRARPDARAPMRRARA